MKKLHVQMLATALVVFSTASWAATEVTSDAGLTPVGSVSVSGAGTLGGLQHRLAQKADQQGASSYKIISAGGDDKYFGVATLYK
ncbi:DUF1471 domain-containing protein [Kosakonia sp. BK9b]|uniref:DUF1471 domain-containing protein n=1 Tax=Kosakonia sp. TaxID=1916651 RepID=UPI00289AB0A7|nr:DUF1471 domain-containing protein [Kosakonia sp.]